MIARIQFPNYNIVAPISHLNYFKRSIDHHLLAIMQGLSGTRDEKASHNVGIINAYFAQNHFLTQRHEWEVEKPFACATNPELLNLIYNHITPLNRLLHALELEISKAEQTSFWPKASLEQLKVQTEHCQKEIYDLSNKLNQALLQRCHINKKLNQARHMCQPIEYFTTLCHPSCADFGRDKNLSDDVRIQIYDHLKQHGFLEKDLTIIHEPIAPRPLAFLNAKQKRSNSQARETLTLLKQRIESILDRPKQKTMSSPWFLSFKKKLEGFAAWNFVSNQISRLHTWRYLVYFILSFAAAFALYTTTWPALTFVLGARASEFLSSLLFSTIALSPGFSFVWQKSKAMLHWFGQTMQAHYNDALLETLDNLSLNQRCLEGELARPVLDTAYVNLAQLGELIDTCCTRSQRRLSTPSFWLKWLNPALEDTLRDAQTLLNQQKSLINSINIIICKPIKCLNIITISS